MDLLLVETVDAENPVEGDLRLVDGDLVWSTTLLEEVAQLIRIRLRFFLGEWFLDPTEGIPFFRDILRKNPDSRLVRSIIRRTIQQTPGVVSVQALSLEIGADRVARVEFEAVLSDGVVLRSSDFEPFVLG